jgi:hypothetical protein
MQVIINSIINMLNKLLMQPLNSDILLFKGPNDLQ